MISFLLGVPGKLKTLTDRLTSGRAANLDNLDVAVSTTAPASTALSSATWTGTKAGYLDGAISGRLGSIKAIYRGTITLVYSNTSNTATITAVDTTKSILMNLGGYGTDSGSVNVGSIPYLELTNSTTITASRASGCSGTSKVSYQLVEFN
jgi:hypothetical protein